MSPDQPTIHWRVVWREGAFDKQRDFDTESAAERHAKWLGTATASRTAVKALVYAVTIWVPTEGEVA